MTAAGPTPREPSEFEALAALAGREHRAGRLAEAAAAYREILARRPDVAPIHARLAGVLTDQGKLDEAAAHLGRAVALQPDFLQAHWHLGGILLEQGKLEQAVAILQRALAIDPHDPDTHNLLGTARKEQGQLAAAAAHYTAALAQRPDFAEAHYQRADLKTFRAGDAELAALRALAAEPARLPDGKMTYIHFALGKALEDVGDYAGAFAHFLQGNALKRRQVRYDEKSYQRAFREIAERFDATLLAGHAGAGDPSQTPIFIVGMPRSGSTLVEQILASHPQVFGAGELTILSRLVNSVCDAQGRPLPFPQFATALDDAGWRQLGRSYLAGLPAAAAGQSRITDKMPTNFAYVSLIRLILPHARIIHTMRDPVDTCVSCFSKLFTAGHTFCYDLAELGCYYRWYYELMEHWREVLPPEGAMLDVSYEAVVGNLEEQARRLIGFCGLPWDDRCLNFHQTDRRIATGSNVQVRQPLYQSSLARWRRYETFLEPLLAELEGCRPGQT